MAEVKLARFGLDTGKLLFRHAAAAYRMARDSFLDVPPMMPLFQFSLGAFPPLGFEPAHGAFNVVASWGARLLLLMMMLLLQAQDETVEWREVVGCSRTRRCGKGDDDADVVPFG